MLEKLKYYINYLLIKKLNLYIICEYNILNNKKCGVGRGTMQILKSDDNKLIAIREYKNIIIATNQKKEKTYNTFQLNLPAKYISLLMDKSRRDQQTYFYLEKITNKHYRVIETSELKNAELMGLIKLKLPIPNKQRQMRVTLPKNKIPYLKAYETYLNIRNTHYLDTSTKIIEKYAETKTNDEIKELTEKEAFKVYQLRALISLQLKVNPETAAFEPRLTISFDADIDPRFIEYIKKINNNNIPDWLEYLTTPI